MKASGGGYPCPCWGFLVFQEPPGSTGERRFGAGRDHGIATSPHHATCPVGRGQLHAHRHVAHHLAVAAVEAESHLDALVGRSEEHTSELQSRLHLVCRLLLEKK